MEARRLERQRRDSAKSSAVESLPSTQDHEFNYRLIDLYAQHECLWNTSLREHSDVEQKRQAWEDISQKLGPHMKASFVRSRIANMRYRLNLYKLQMIEYKMGPDNVKQPEKLYYIDRFAFLERINSPTLEPIPSASDRKLDTGPSIASMVKLRMQQQQQHDQLPHVLRGLNDAGTGSNVGIASVVKRRVQDMLPLAPSKQSEHSVLTQLPKFQTSLQSARQMLQQARLQNRQADRDGGKRVGTPDTNLDSSLQGRMNRLSLVKQGKLTPTDSLDSTSDLHSSRLNIPSVVRKRMRKIANQGLQLEKSSSNSFPQVPESMGIIAHSGRTLRAQPGDSVSKTKLSSTKHSPRPRPQPDAHRHSDDEELYRLHWTVRQQRRTRRSTGTEYRSDPLPPMKLDTNSSFTFKHR